MIAIILSRRDFREFDQIISCYTKANGKVELLARGVKKITSKNSVHLEPFSFVDIEIAPGKGIDRLTKVQPINYFVNIRNDLQKSLIAGYAVSLLDKVLHVGEKDERLFAVTLSWLEKICDMSESIFNSSKSVLLDGFIVKLLNCLGYDITHAVGLETALKKYLEQLKVSDWETISNIQYPISNIQKSHIFIYNFLVERLEMKVKDWGTISTPLLVGEGEG